MPFSADITPPSELRTEEFLLRLITVEDADLDYEAVMESRDFLRFWEQSTWPAADFTLEANREDLERLEEWNGTGAAYTYTLLDPTEAECLGCVYVFPTNASFLRRSTVTAVGGRAWSDYQATVHFWVRKSRVLSGLDRMLLDVLRSWIADEWDLERHLFVTNEQFEQQAELLADTDLQRLFHIDEPGKPGTFLAFG